jgi:hypothetical protein
MKLAILTILIILSTGVTALHRNRDWNKTSEKVQLNIITGEQTKHCSGEATLLTGESLQSDAIKINCFIPKADRNNKLISLHLRDQSLGTSTNQLREIGASRGDCRNSKADINTLSRSNPLVKRTTADSSGKVKSPPSITKSEPSSTSKGFKKRLVALRAGLIEIKYTTIIHITSEMTEFVNEGGLRSPKLIVYFDTRMGVISSAEIVFGSQVKPEEMRKKFIEPILSSEDGKFIKQKRMNFLKDFSQIVNKLEKTFIGLYMKHYSFNGLLGTHPFLPEEYSVGEQSKILVGYNNDPLHHLYVNLNKYIFETNDIRTLIELLGKVGVKYSQSLNTVDADKLETLKIGFYILDKMHHEDMSGVNMNYLDEFLQVFDKLMLSFEKGSKYDHANFLNYRKFKTGALDLINTDKRLLGIFNDNQNNYYRRANIYFADLKKMCYEKKCRTENNSIEVLGDESTKAIGTLMFYVRKELDPEEEVSLEKVILDLSNQVRNDFRFFDYIEFFDFNYVLKNNI